MSFFSDLNIIYSHRNEIANLKQDIKELKYYKPKNFCVEEFVDPEIFHKRGSKSLQLMNPKILITADRIRDYFDRKMTINNWKWGGSRMWSGLRTASSSYHSMTSQHTFGNAIDFLIDGIDSKDVRKEIIKNQKDPAFEFVTRLEEFEGMSWVHVDCANVNSNKILIVGP
jgi:hypothetical protein